MDDGTIENLGHFSDLMPFHRPGFIVRVYSTHNKEYLLAVTNKSMINTGVYVIDEVPWDTWNGDSHESKLFQGDNLETYKKFREGVTGV
ncbi:MAG: hypothetical protein IMZ53_02970 [Thermoplasmata archaeon]|nr:hypothetical protein [Thermoplasmata archaeon]